MTKNKKILLAVLAIILLAAALVGPIMSNVERPTYQLTASTGAIEIRDYDPRLVATVTVSGPRKDAIRSGFKILADYIFGNNTTASNISMTAPVEQSQGEKISMTAPVEQQIDGMDWRITFTMPSQYTIDTLPKPMNQSIQIELVPAKTQAAITFSGMNSSDNLEKHELALKNHIDKTDWVITGSAHYAFYNPPWTLPFLRRNEILFDIRRK